MNESQKRLVARVIAVHAKHIVSLTSKGTNLVCSGTFCDWRYNMPANEPRPPVEIHADHVTDVIQKVVFE